MNEKKHIDRLFQEKFKDFDIEPNDEVWNKIERSLKQKKKKRKPIVIWWRLGGAAAVLLMLLTFGNVVYKSVSTNNPIVNTEADNTTYDVFKETDATLEDSSSVRTKHLEQKQFQNTHNVANNNTTQKEAINQNKPNSNSKKTINQNQGIIAGSDNNASKAIKNTIASKSKINGRFYEISTKLLEEKNIDKVQEYKKDIASEDTTKKSSITNNTEETTDTPNNTTNQKPSIEDAIAKQEALDDNEKDNENEEKNRKWLISPNLAPVVFNSIGNGSPIDNQFNENSKASDINLSYGIRGSYALSKRLSVRLGINNVNLNQNTGDVLVVNTDTDVLSVSAIVSISSNMKRNTNAQDISLMSNTALRDPFIPEIINTSNVGIVEQRFGFIEIPFELEYRLLDKKFGINVISGFSTLFLNNNEIFVDINGTSTLAGEATNINSTSFSANFGLGVGYDVSERWNLNLEPMVKYQINTFTNTPNNFRPYFFGIYTGLSYKF